MKLSKRVSKAFGKKIFLLGKFKSGELFWLEEAKWACDWYWGFGYVETYTNNRNPELSKDIRSHQHFNGLALCQPEYYDTEKKTFRKRDFCHILTDNPEIEVTVLSNSELWELSDLMKTFYTLKDTAEIFHQGNSHYTGNGKLNLKDETAEKNINENLLPKVFERIYEILTPKQSEIQ